MEEISTEIMKEMQLAILIDVADFCEKNKIRYYLTGGTLIGAIRHQGFIPWDDDIDIAMPRPDYERFIKSYSSKNYNVYCWEKDNTIFLTYAKVYHIGTLLYENADYGASLGVNIDIFPIDGLPNNFFKIKRRINFMKKLWGLVVCASIIDDSKRSIKKRLQIRIMRQVYKVISKHMVSGYIIRQAQKYSFEVSDNVACVVWGYGMKEVLPIEIVVNYTKANFEGHEFNIPKKYDELLGQIYGNYMQLPPKEEQVFKHDSRAYWKR